MMRTKKIISALTAAVLSVCAMGTVTAAGAFGDVNGDGKLTIRDVSQIALSIAKGKGSSLSSEADFNKDGKKDVRDAAFMAGFIAQKPTFEEMLKQVNQVRAKVGAQSLKLDDRTCAAASLRAHEAAVKFSHTRPDGSDCFTVAKQYGINYSYIGENIAAGSGTVSGTMTQWINSEGHYKNIINPNYAKLGVGLVRAPGSFYGCYWVQIFMA